ncbi:hypothetical protein [Plesiocystis pacifica]|nr:hypothetical protein [Plesiocystis pacifica]
MSAFEKLRKHARETGDPPHVLAQVLAKLLGRELCGRVIVGGLGQAFPTIPLDELLKATIWRRVTADGDGMSDAEFDALLGKWIADDLVSEERSPT